ncbi:MAG: sigma-70 family RNA polymerase sigma factor [Planctomycetia bacterium]|nr:sigma-70 family RNA polymerase sigma factor [Planctomycetia bacterium]
MTPYLAALYRVPLLTPRQERHLFRRYNYLKYTAAMLRKALDSAPPEKPLLDDIEELHAQAEQTRNQIIEANLRLVVSLAKPRVSNPGELQDLISDGNMALLRAVEKFDYMLGNKFSTYATWAIRHSLARSIPNATTHGRRFCNGMEEAIAALPDRGDSRSDDEAAGNEWRGKIQQVLGHLTQREKYIVVRRFGLAPGGQRKTLQALGDEMGVTKERVRQLEHRAIDKLRAALADSQ